MLGPPTLLLCRKPANRFSPATRNFSFASIPDRLCHQGALVRDGKAGGGRCLSLSAFCSREQCRTRLLLLPGRSSSFPKQPRNPHCSFSIFHLAERAVVLTPGPEILHKPSGIPFSESGSQPQGQPLSTETPAPAGCLLHPSPSPKIPVRSPLQGSKCFQVFALVPTQPEGEVAALRSCYLCNTLEFSLPFFFFGCTEQLGGS